jgi:hypothetical protein
MLVVEHQGVPIGGLVASGQQAEVKLAEATLVTVKVSRSEGRPVLVLRKWWWTRDTTVPLAPLFEKQRDQVLYSRAMGQKASAAWLGNYPRLVVRYEWLAHIYLAFVMVAFILICLAHF